MKAQRNQRALGKWQGAEKTTGRWGRTTGRWMKRQGAAPCSLGLARTLWKYSGCVKFKDKHAFKDNWKHHQDWTKRGRQWVKVSEPETVWKWNSISIRITHCAGCNGPEGPVPPEASDNVGLLGLPGGERAPLQSSAAHFTCCARFEVWYLACLYSLFAGPTS